MTIFIRTYIRVCVCMFVRGLWVVEHKLHGSVPLISSYFIYVEY
jgi:hypothetical protein